MLNTDANCLAVFVGKLLLRGDEVVANADYAAIKDSIWSADDLTTISSLFRKIADRIEN